MNRRQRVAWGLVIGGFVLISVLCVVSLMIAPWEVWSSTSPEHEDTPTTPADVLVAAAMITALALIVVVPSLSIAAGWAGAALLLAPIYTWALVYIEVVVQVNPEMNMVGLMLIWPILLSGFALLITAVAAIFTAHRRTRRAAAMTAPG